MFKGHCFPKEVILQAVYLKLRFSLSYRDLEELLSIRGVTVDHVTIQRWVYKFTPLIECGIKKRRKTVNEKLSQWQFGQLLKYLGYKLQAKGITLEKVNEAYSSQTCPVCTRRKKPFGRV